MTNLVALPATISIQRQTILDKTTFVQLILKSRSVMEMFKTFQSYLLLKARIEQAKQRNYSFHNLKKFLK